MILVRDILEEIADDVGGHGIDLNCSDAAENKVLKVYHEASRKLMMRGDFEGTDREVCLQVTNGCVTLDRRIETIKQYLVGDNPGRIHNDNFRYIQQGDFLGGHCFSGEVLEDIGDYHPLIVDLPCSMTILAVSDRPECADATLRIQGVDIHGREVNRQWDGDPGFCIPIVPDKDGNPSFTGADDYNSGKLKMVTALSKPRTAGYVYIYGYNPGYAPVWLVTMAPDETRSQHRRYRVPGITASTTLDMTAKVSMRWVKQYPGDVALIQNIDAFQWMAKAINAKDDDEIGEYNHFFNKALSELKHQRAKKHPAQTSTLNVRMSRRAIRGAHIRRKPSSGFSINPVKEVEKKVVVSTTTPATTTSSTPCETTAVTCSTSNETCVNGFADIAATDIGGLRTVYLDDDGELRLATPEIAPAVGIIRDAVTEGKNVFVYQSGPINGFTGLAEGQRYYMGANGVPTLTPVEEGFSQFLGIAQSETVLVANIGEAVEL